MDLVELNVLGLFRMKRGGQSLADAASDKARALLTLLALEGAQSRMSLRVLLWPDLPQDAAFETLRKTLYRLRQRLEAISPGAASLLISSRESVQLDPSRVEVDALRLRALLAECRQHNHANLVACDECLARLALAVDLYQGELLAGFGLSDAPEFEMWLLLHRESLQQQALGALTDLATAWEARGDLARAHTYVSRILMLDPLREEVQRQQMRLLAALGQRNQALQQYETLRRVLRETLGVEPDPESVALYEQIRRGELSPLAAPPPLSRQVAENPLPAASPQPMELPKWGEVPETGRVYGRADEVAELERWLSDERCQVVAILGIGGMGKTTLAATVARALAGEFDKVVWRSLLNAPPLEELLQSILQSISQEPLVELPPGLDQQVALLIGELRQQRCLLILDNLESIMLAEGIGQMRAGYEGYGQLIRQMAEIRHNSSLLLTSRERPQDMARWEEDLPWVRSQQLEGLDPVAARAILDGRGLNGQAVDGSALVERYSGHPLALKLVAETIQEIFAGDIGAFLASDMLIFDDIRAVLDQQFDRLPLLEQEILFWLAVEREPISLDALRADLVPTRTMQEVVQALRALQRRSLVQRAYRGHASTPSHVPGKAATESRFATPNVILEYLVERLIKTACQEIMQETLFWVHKHALMQAQAQEYVRQSQSRLILAPIANRLEALIGRSEIANRVVRILAALRAEASPPHGYAVGNLLNLIYFLEIEIGPLNLTGLDVWQADLRQANLAGSNLAGADLSRSRFADTFTAIRAVAVSPDGTLVAGGTSGGEIRLWDVATGQLVQVCQGHTGAVRSVSFRADGKVFASGSEDRTVRLWRVEGSSDAAAETEHLPHILQGHAQRVISVAFHPEGKILASCCTDGTVRLWDVASGETQTVLEGHESWVWAVAFSPDGKTLASGGYDRVIRLWDVETATLRATLVGHKTLVSSLVFDATGARLVSGSYDYSVYVWDVVSGQKLFAPEDAKDLITCVALSPDGNLLASGGDERLIRVWDLRTGHLAFVFHGHTDVIGGLAFTPNGQMLVSGGADQRICLWDLRTSGIRHIFTGHSQTIRSLAFHPHGRILASSHYDRVVRLWDLEKHAVSQTLYGHTLALNSVAWNPDGTMLASACDDTTVQLWTISAQGHARRRLVLHAHERDVTAVCFLPDGKTLVSCSEDQTIAFWRLEDGQLQRRIQAHDIPIWSVIVDPQGKMLASAGDRNFRLWDAQDAHLFIELEGHANFIWSLAFSPDSLWLASGGSDGSIGLWDVRDPAHAHLKHTLHGHTDRAFVVAFHPNGRWLASAGADRTVRLWDLQTHETIHTLTGHTHWIWALAFSSDGSTLASAGVDGTIRLWDSQRGEVVDVLQTPGLYPGINIRAGTGTRAA